MTPFEMILLLITLLLTIAISVTLWQVRQFLCVATDIKRLERTLIDNQALQERQEVDANLPMEGLNSDFINNWQTETQQVNLQDYEVVTPRRSF